MLLTDIKNFQIYSRKTSYGWDDLKVRDILEPDELYKIDIHKLANIELIGEFTLNKSNYANADKFPENALTIGLSKGDFVMVYKNGGIVSKNTGKMNECIKSSIGGDVSFDELSFTAEELASMTADNVGQMIAQKNYCSIKSFTFKGSAKSKLHLWIDDDSAIGSFTFEIYKIPGGKKTPELLFSTILKKDADFNALLSTSVMYDVSVKKIDNSFQKNIVYKYPVGTYQVALNEKIASAQGVDELERAIQSDTAGLRISGGKLQNLVGISIPNDVNPMNYYMMIGRLQLTLYIDFNRDEFYIYPTAYAECFMNLFLPDMDVKEVEITDSYAVYSINDFTIVDYQYKDPDRIRNNIMKWISCSLNDIKSDNRELFFYVETYTLYGWYYRRFKKLIDSHFIKLHIWSAKARSFDNVEMQFENQNEILEYSILECQWRIEDATAENYNYISWKYDDMWKNTDVTNRISLDCHGSGVLLISKKHFENILDVTGLPHDATEGNFTDQQFRLLNVNPPEITPYQRFQHWLGIKIQ